MFKKNLHIFTTISTVKDTKRPRSKEYYVVTYDMEYDIVIFGHFIRHVKTTEKVPFIFSTLDIAKDFCKIKPMYDKYIITNKYGNVFYHTYRLNVNGNVVGYIKWEMNSVVYYHATGEYEYHYKYVDVNPIVDCFAKGVEIKYQWYDIRSIRDITFDREQKTLSLMINEGFEDTDNIWKFELVENKK